MALPPLIYTENCAPCQAPASARRYSARMQVDAPKTGSKRFSKSNGAGFGWRHEGRTCHSRTQGDSLQSELCEGRCGRPGNAEPPEFIALKLFHPFLACGCQVENLGFPGAAKEGGGRGCPTVLKDTQFARFGKLRLGFMFQCKKNANKKL